MSTLQARTIQVISSTLLEHTGIPLQDRPVLGDAVARYIEQVTASKRQGSGRYAALLSMAGTAHSDYTDVSASKHKHLSDIYADSHDNV